jgi:hypothetical protein
MTLALRDPSQHFFMTRSVARVMGLNLRDALESGALEPRVYADMVTRCRGCALVEACQEWLGSQTDLSPTPPPGCCNGSPLLQLKATLPKKG